MRIVKVSAAVVALLIALSALGGYLFLRSRLPERSGELHLAHLHKRVEALFDRWGVPHIYAANREDAYRALGYLHAQDRWFQMELLRRVAHGRLSEILGPELLQIDKLMRTIGIGRFAQEEARSLQNDASDMASSARAYIEGVNACVERCPTPVEFLLLGIEPRPFVMADIYAVGAYMSYTFAQAFHTDPLLTYVEQKWGARHSRDLRSFFPAVTIPSRSSQRQLSSQTSAEISPQALLQLPEQDMNSYRSSSMEPSELSGLSGLSELSLRAAEDIRRVGHILEEGLPFRRPYLAGSNAWSIAPSLSARGSVIFAGDPHISYASPSVWYEAHIKTPQFELYGHYLALVPFALLGHSRHHAWSLTVFLNDDIDFYQERVNPENRDQVWGQGRWQDLRIIEDTIPVKGQGSESLRLRISSRGPIINDVVGGIDGNQQPVAMRWYLYQFYRAPEADFMRPFYGLGQARSLDEARKAVSQIYAPGLNVVYGDRDGNVAWWAAARLPLRSGGNRGSNILSSALPKGGVRGYAAFASNPQSENPAAGFVFSANQKTTDRFPGYYVPPYRAYRIIEQISSLSQSGKKMSADDMKRLQTDNHHQAGVDLRDQVAPLLERRPEAQDREIERQALQIFRQWQGSHEIDEIAPTIYNEYYYQLLRGIFLDELGEDYFKDFCRSFIHHDAIARLLSDPNSIWWDDVSTEGRQESATDIIIAAWDRSLRVLEERLGDRIDAAWRWGEVHRLEHGHPLGSIGLLRPFFNVGPFPAPGARESLNNVGFWPRSYPWPPILGPSTRRVIDFADPGRSFGILPTGQSGYFFDDHYDDQAELYIQGHYRYQYMDRDDIEGQGRGQLNLLPIGSAH